MGFYDLSKAEREKKCREIQACIVRAIQDNGFSVAEAFFDDSDTYIRKAAYLAMSLS